MNAAIDKTNLRLGGLVDFDPVGPSYNRTPAGAHEASPLAGAVGHCFPVKVWQDGGSTDGSKTAPCNRTYKVRTIDATGPDAGGSLLGTGMTPQARRPILGRLDTPPATGGGMVGLGYHLAGVFVLWSANETLYPEGCA